jgi:HAMP domain-containing protein
MEHLVSRRACLLGAVVALNIDDVNSTVARLALIDALAGAAGIVLLAFAGLLLIRASLAPLTRIEDTAEAIAAGNLSERVDHPGTRTEVGRLANALNTMLGKIEAAYIARADGEARARDSEDRMRQFVADASHELRTPLAASAVTASSRPVQAIGMPLPGPAAVSIKAAKSGRCRMVPLPVSSSGSASR